MAATTFSTTLRNGRADAIKTAIDAGGAAGKLRIYDGTRPAGGGAATTLLAELTLSYPSAGAASSGALTLSAITSDTSADATGTATWARHTLLVDLFFGSAVVVLSGTVAATTDDVTADAAGKVWVKGPAVFTSDDVSTAAAGTVSAGAGSNTGTVAFTTAVFSHAAEGNNIPPPGAFPVTDDYRLRKNIQPIPRMAVVHRGTMAGRVAWWNRR